MGRLLVFLLSACLLSNSFAAEKQYTEEEVKKLVREYSDKHVTASGLDLSLPAEYKAGYRNTHKDDFDLREDDQRNSVVFTQGKSHFIPFDPSSGDMWTIAAATTAAVIVFANDQEVMNFVQDHKNDMTKKVAFFGEGFGSEWPMYAAAGGYILGVILKDDGTKSYALMGAKAMLVSSIANYALKNIFHRERPSTAETPYNFEGLDGKFGSNVSFPSGHTTLAFSAATYIAETNKDKGPLIPILAYSAAAITAWSRMHDKAHWGSDVIMGALMGHLITKSMLNSKAAEKGFIITPGMDFNGTYYVNISYSGKPKSAVDNCGRGIESTNEKIRVCIEAAFASSAR